jgi:O-antigen/teichoic acid export membrane protein
MASQSFVRHALVFGLGSLLLHAAGVLLVPLYTRLLSPEEFGILEVFNRVAEVASVCLLMGGLRQAVVVLYGRTENERQRQAVACTSVVMLACGTLLGAAAILAVLSQVGDGLALGQPLLLHLAVVALLLENICVALLAFSQLRLESVFFVAVNCGHLLVRVALCVLFVGWLGWGVGGVVTAALLTSALYAALVAGRELWRGPLRLDLGYVWAMVRFAVPLAPCGICFFLLNNGDRFFLLSWAGEREVGLYAFGYKLAAVVPLFSRGPLMMTWGQRMFELARQPDAVAVFGRAFTRILAAYVFVGLGLCLLVDEAIAVVGGPAFADSAAVVAPVVLAYFFLAAADLMDSAFYVRGRSGLKMCATLPSTAVAVVAYAVLIPVAGAMGAALATLAAFACHALTTRLLSHRVFPVRWEAGRVTAMLALAVGLWLTSHLLPRAAWAVPVRVGLWALWPAVLWATGLVNAAEKAQIRSSLRACWTWLRRLRSDNPKPPRLLFEAERRGERGEEVLSTQYSVLSTAPSEADATEEKTDALPGLVNP